MASSRRVISTLASIGKIKASKKHPDRLYLELGFGKKGAGHKFGGYFPLRVIPTEDLQNIIINWLTPAYEAVIEGKCDPYTGAHYEEEYVRVAMDLCYKELARRAEKVHK